MQLSPTLIVLWQQNNCRVIQDTETGRRIAQFARCWDSECNWIYSDVQDPDEARSILASVRPGCVTVHKPDFQVVWTEEEFRILLLGDFYRVEMKCGEDLWTYASSADSPRVLWRALKGLSEANKRLETMRMRALAAAVVV